MKKSKTAELKPDFQNRLAAYSTAASLGAFFCGQNAEAQVTASPAFAPYPHIILPNVGGAGPATDYHYFQVDGGAASDFNLNVNSNRVDIGGSTVTNIAIDSTPPDAYIVPWTVGSTIDASTAAAPFYRNFLSTGYKVGPYHYENSKFLSMGAMGFSYVSGIDHQTHFGYMDIQIPVTNTAPGQYYVQKAIITGVFYNKTPNAPITVSAPPVFIVVSSINLGAGNAVTINFTSTDDAAPSAFTLQTSPALGAAANWVTDPAASISSSGPGVYTATTTATAGAARFYRIVEN